MTAAVALLLGSVPAAVAAPVAAKSGECSSVEGVTVVVDFTDLGGGVVVRCAGSGSMNGLQALDAAGFSLTGTQRQGLAFVCRIDGRPAADERLAVEGDPDYTEQCVDTPPANAYWAYFYASDGGTWKYSTSGPSSHQAVAGGYEGWRFELNRSGSGRAPGYTPVKTPVAEKPTPTPTPTETKSASSGGTSSPAVTPTRKPTRKHTAAASGATSTPTASATSSPLLTASPSAVAAPSGQPADEARTTSGPSAAGTLAALAAIGLVALAGGGVAWRRSRRP